VRKRFAFAIVAALAASFAAGENTFHLTFGTTNSPQQRHADTATEIVETESGDLVVAGEGAAYYSDTGSTHTNPMVARISARGVLEWQRVYDELENHRIIAFASRGEEQYMLLAQPVPSVLVNTVTLRRIDEVGNPSEALATLDGIWVGTAVLAVEGESPHFLVAAKRAATDLEAYAADVELLRLDLQGRITEQSFETGVTHLQHLQQVDEQGFLFYKYDEREIARSGRNGETEVLVTIVDGLCGSVVASRDRIVCAQFPWMRTDETNDAIIAYSPAGQELWRRNLARDHNVRQMQLLESGDLIYAYQASENPTVDRLSPSGGLVWSQTLRSAGPFTFLGNIELLADGRLAFLGSTGPWNGFVSEDTNAMLVVTGTSEDDLNASEIVSNIVDCATVDAC
jgi:hypothetical protein